MSPPPAPVRRTSLLPASGKARHATPVICEYPAQSSPAQLGPGIAAQRFRRPSPSQPVIQIGPSLAALPRVSKYWAVDAGLDQQGGVGSTHYFPAGDTTNATERNAGRIILQ